jgi:hypothetical protein
VDLWHVSLLTGVIAGALAVGFVGWLMPARRCPDCGRVLPKLRKPSNRREALHGGWTCPSCGCVVDRRGQKIL